MSVISTNAPKCYHGRSIEGHSETPQSMQHSGTEGLKLERGGGRCWGTGVGGRGPQLGPSQMLMPLGRPRTQSSSRGGIQRELVIQLQSGTPFQILLGGEGMGGGQAL